MKNSRIHFVENINSICDKTNNTRIIYLSIIFISSLAFLLIYGHYVLIPTNTDWLLSGGDLSQHYLGWKAYRNVSLPDFHYLHGLYPVVCHSFQTSLTTFAGTFSVFWMVGNDVFHSTRNLDSQNSTALYKKHMVYYTM